MTTEKKSPATRCNGDQAVENLGRDLDTDHATPHRLMLSPTSGNDWWNWCLSINGRPAIRFRDIDRAALALTYALDDMENGIDITTRASHENIAEGSLRPRDVDTHAYELCPGWS